MREGPSWLGIGAQRCGTTWFTDLLVQHPKMDVAGGTKEHHLLYGSGLTKPWTSEDRDHYREIFTSEELKLGEFTPYYLRASWIVEQTADALPEDAPILVLVRDPIDRFASAIRHEMAAAARRYRKALATKEAQINGTTKVPRTTSGKVQVKKLLVRMAPDLTAKWVYGPPRKPPEAFLDNTWLRFVGSDATWGGMFAAQLEAWTGVLPDDRFIVIQYEKLRKNPQHYADLVWERLGLKPVPLEAIERPSGSSTVTETWVPDDYPNVVRALQEMYRPDGERLAKKFDIDLSLWKRTYSDVSDGARAAAGKRT